MKRRSCCNDYVPGVCTKHRLQNYIEDQEVFSVKIWNKTIAIKQLLWWVKHKLKIHASSKWFTRQKSLIKFHVIIWESCIVFGNARIGIFFFFLGVNFNFVLVNYSIRMVSYIQPVVLGFFLHNYVVCIKFTSRCVLLFWYG